VVLAVLFVVFVAHGIGHVQSAAHFKIARGDDEDCLGVFAGPLKRPASTPHRRLRFAILNLKFSILKLARLLDHVHSCADGDEAQ
jgi:hypothetical protein